MTNMMEALGDYYNVDQATLQEVRELQESVPNNNDRPDLQASSVPTKRQNKQRSGRSARKAARSRQALQAVGGVTAPRWNPLLPATLPSDHNMCKVVGADHKQHHSHRNNK